MKSFDNHAGRGRDAARPRPAGLARRDLIKGGAGIAYPYEDAPTAAASIESAPISEVVRAKICHGNAERMLQQ